MNPRFYIILVHVFFPIILTVAQPPPAARITVVGSVFCDVCYNNSFTKHSYFLPGADVHVKCRFQANTPRTTEQITFSVKRTTNIYGIYRLDIPSIDGVDCVESAEIQSFCEATLIGSSFPGCNVPGISTTSKQITLESENPNLCVYKVSTLSYKPLKRNSTLCGNHNFEKDKLLSSNSFNSSKFFLPYFPWPQLPSFPPFPPLPPLPPLSPFPWRLPPSLPYPFPPLPPFIPRPPQTPPSPPLPSDPRTWIPKNPFLPPPLPPPTDPRTWVPNNPFLPPPLPPPIDPRTWVPNNPFLSPLPPGFNLRDPRTWIPNVPPSPPINPQSQHP